MAKLTSFSPPTQESELPMKQDPLPAGRLPMLAREDLENYMWNSFVKRFPFNLHVIAMSSYFFSRQSTKNLRFVQFFIDI